MNVQVLLVAAALVLPTAAFGAAKCDTVLNGTTIWGDDWACALKEIDPGSTFGTYNAACRTTKGQAFFLTLYADLSDDEVTLIALDKSDEVIFTFPGKEVARFPRCPS